MAFCQFCDPSDITVRYITAQKRLQAVGFLKGCPGCPKAPIYIAGRVTDAFGTPLAGVRLVCYNDWYRYPVVLSKVSGEYDFAIIQAEATWFVEVVDTAGTPISPQAAVQIDPTEACWLRLDWQRVD